MKKLIGILIGVAFATGVPVFAQTPAKSDVVSTASAQIYDACLAKGMGAKMECACVTGFMAASLKDDELRIMAVISPFIDAKGDVADLAGAQKAAFAERDAAGISQTRFMEIMDVFTKLGPIGVAGDRACLIVKTR